MKVFTVLKQWSLLINFIYPPQATNQLSGRCFTFSLVLALPLAILAFPKFSKYLLKFILLWSSLSCQSGGAFYFINPLKSFLLSSHKLTCHTYVHVAGSFLCDICRSLSCQIPNIELSICRTLKYSSKFHTFTGISNLITCCQDLKQECYPKAMSGDCWF